MKIIQKYGKDPKRIRQHALGLVSNVPMHIMRYGLIIVIFVTHHAHHYPRLRYHHHRHHHYQRQRQM